MTSSGASTGVMCPSPGSSVSPTQCGSAAARARACTAGVSRSAVPTTTAVGTLNSRTPMVEIERRRAPATRRTAPAAGRRARSARTPRPCPGRRTGPHRRVLEDPPGERCDGPERRPRAEHLPWSARSASRPARIGTTSDSATSRELPVLHSSTAAAACSRNRARPAAAISVMPAHGVPGEHGPSPRARAWRRAPPPGRRRARRCCTRGSRDCARGPAGRTTITRWSVARSRICAAQKAVEQVQPCESTTAGAPSGPCTSTCSRAPSAETAVSSRTGTGGA